MKRLKEQRLLDPAKNTTKKCKCYHIVLERQLQRERAGIMHEESGWQTQTNCEQKTAGQECILFGIATPVITIPKIVINSK